MLDRNFVQDVVEDLRIFIEKGMVNDYWIVGYLEHKIVVG